MRRRALISIATLSLALFAACESDSVDATATVEQVGPSDNLTASLIIPAQTPRLTADELQASIPRVAGLGADGNDIQWTANFKGNTVPALSDEAFGAMLGRPDYVFRTDEDAEATPLYVKFMGDMARDVCTKMTAASIAQPAAPSLWPLAPVDGSATADDINANIQRLVLRLLGLRVATDDAFVASLASVYAAGVAGTPPTPIVAAAEGWRTVCVSLLQDPLFHLY